MTPICDATRSENLQCFITEALSYHCKRLIQHRKGRLPTRQTSIEQAQARDNHPDEISADGKIDIMELEAGELKVDVDFFWVTTIGGGWIELGLYGLLDALTKGKCDLRPVTYRIHDVIFWA